MTNKCGMLNAECGMNAVASNGARSPFSICPARPHSAFRFPLSAFPSGLTLIELLITIVIMVTVLAGALPLLSPNNNSRKLREASRQLNSLLSQAQAQAARDGRPVGVAFRESGTAVPHSGMALEAYLIAVPPPFAGFSEHSRVVVGDTGTLYGPGGSFTNPRFSPRYNGYKICQLTFWASGAADAFPPHTLKIGDVINVGGNSFLICDDVDQTTMPNQTEMVNGVEYLLSDPSASAPIPGTVLNAIWLNFHGQQLPQVPAPPAIPVGQAYQILRQPVNSSDQPLQFPRGIGVDLQASGADGFSVPPQFDEVLPITSTKVTPLTIGVMFSPNGSLETLYVDGVRKDGVEQVYFLMGLIENGNTDVQDPADYDFTNGTGIFDDELAQRRTRINWLNPDSRWVSVNRAGRIITTENFVSFNPRLSPYADSVTGTPHEQNLARLLLQLNGNGPNPGARQNAKNMNASTGR